MAGPTFYTPSGNFTLAGVARGLLFGTLWGVLGAFVYAYAIIYIPIIEVNLVLAIGYGLVIGIATAMSLQGGKVRNRTAAFVAAAATGLLSWYTSWAVWIYALFRRSGIPVRLGEVVSDPNALWHVVAAVNRRGTWRFHGFTPTGVVLWILWAVEAAVILGIAVGLGGGLPFGTFCEECQSWCDGKVKGRLAAGDADELRRLLEKKDMGALEKLGPAGPDAWLDLSLELCPKCGKTNTLTAALVTVSIVGKGQRVEGRKALVSRLLLSAAEVGAFRQLLESAAGAAATLPPPPDGAATS